MEKSERFNPEKQPYPRLDMPFFFKGLAEAANQMAVNPALLESFLHEYAMVVGSLVRCIPENIRSAALTAPVALDFSTLQPHAGLAEVKKSLPQLLWQVDQEKNVPQSLLVFLHNNTHLCGFVRSSFHTLLLAVVNLRQVRPHGVLTPWVTGLTRAGNARKIAASPYFNAAWYRKSNSDIKISNPALHYLLQGWREGREPGPLFSGNAYLRANPDVLAARCNPLLHYINHGNAEGRLCFAKDEIFQDHLYWIEFFTQAQVCALSNAGDDFKLIQKKALTYLGLWRERRATTSRIAVHPGRDCARRQGEAATTNYHYFIFNNGHIALGRRADDVAGWQGKDIHESVEVWLERGYPGSPAASEGKKLAPAQAHSLERLLCDLTARYPDAKVMNPHSAVSPARYFQFDAAAWWQGVQGRVQNSATERTAAPPKPPGWTPADLRRLRTHPPATTAFIELRRRQMPSCCHIRWSWAAWRDISPHIKNAVIFLEDSLFWTHRGLLFMRQARLFRQFLLHRQHVGGSTITQQVVKNLYLSPQKTLGRKIKEALLALLLEQKLGKKRILEIYLNIAEWGPGIFGVAAAAKYYFNSLPAALSAVQAAQLAALLPAPLMYTPGMPYLQDKIWYTVCRLEKGHLPVGLPQELKREFRGQHYYPLP